MIIHHELDIDTSIHVCEVCGDSIELKRCYNNVYDTIRHFGDKFFKNEWRIAYGYVTAIDGILARHAFLIDKNNKVIDPTLAKSKYFLDGEDKIYISFKIFDTLSHYLNALMVNDNNPDMYRDFEEEEKQARIWAKERCITLVK